MGTPMEMAVGVTEQWGVHIWSHLDMECTGRAGANEEVVAATREQYLWMGGLAFVWTPTWIYHFST